MISNIGKLLCVVLMVAALVMTGLFQSWAVAISIFNLCVISAIMALGVNIQWGYAGLFNVGTMGFAALGGISVVLISSEPVSGAINAGGANIGIGFLILALTAIAAYLARRRLTSWQGSLAMTATMVMGYFLARSWLVSGITAVENFDPARSGFLGGLGLPVAFSWLGGAVVAAVAALIIGRITLGLRSDYLAIATLGISEVIIAILRNEDWLTRGVRNVNGLPSGLPDPIILAETPIVDWIAASSGLEAVNTANLLVSLLQGLMAASVLLLIFFFCQKALKSPWGRMMWAIRDNRDAAAAIGKNVSGRHLEVFVIGSAIVGLAGAMLVSFDGQFTPGSYNPLRFTFLIWVMVIIGGSGNNFGSVFGGFLIWFVWIQAEVFGGWFAGIIVLIFDGSPSMQAHLMGITPHARMILMGLIMILSLKYFPKGFFPEKR